MYPNKKRKAVTQPEGERSHTDILRLRQQEFHYAYIAEYEEETWGGRIVGIHLELECIRADWFNRHPNPPWPPVDRIGLAAGIFHTTLVASPDLIQDINGQLTDPDDQIPMQDQYDRQPAHLHEGNWVEARFQHNAGVALVIRRPSTPDIRSLLAAPVESIWGLTGLWRIRPPSLLARLRRFSLR